MTFFIFKYLVLTWNFYDEKNVKWIYAPKKDREWLFRMKNRWKSRFFLFDIRQCIHQNNCIYLQLHKNPMSYTKICDYKPVIRYGPKFLDQYFFNLQWHSIFFKKQLNSVSTRLFASQSMKSNCWAKSHRNWFKKIYQVNHVLIKVEILYTALTHLNSHINKNSGVSPHISLFPNRTIQTPPSFSMFSYAWHDPVVPYEILLTVT